MSHRLFLIILLLCSAVPAPAQDSFVAKQQARIETIQRIAPSVVCVMPAGGQGGGSGVLISPDGYAISNYHVTSGSGDFMKCGLNDGRLYDAVIVGIDPTGDVALIKLLGRDDFPYCTPGDSDRVRVGDEVMALGNPFLLADDFSPTVTYGIASGIRRYQYPANTFLEYTDCIQIDASINPGNSGGPLFDIEGRWIGINGRASFEKRGRINSGAAYAISVNQVLMFINHLKSGRIVDHGRTEFTVGTVDDVVEIQQVSELSDVYRRGMRPGDELISFAGRTITSANDFKNVMGIFPEGTRVPVVFRQDDEIQTITTRLSPLHQFQKAPPLPMQQKLPEIPKEQEPGKSGPADKLLDTKPQPPKQYEKLFVKKDGFTNFYFNQLNTSRLLQPLLAAIGASGSSSADTWKLKVTATIDGLDYPGLITVNSTAAGMDLEGLPPVLQSAEQMEADSELPQIYGILAGTMQWHRLFQERQGGFSEVLYIGLELLLPSKVNTEILQTRSGTTRSRWGFREGIALPSSVDVQFSSDADEARLRFEDWQDTRPFPVPRRIAIIDHDTETPVWLTIDGIEVTSSQKETN